MNEILNDELMFHCKGVQAPKNASESLNLSDGTHVTDTTHNHRVLGTLNAYRLLDLTSHMQSTSCLSSFKHHIGPSLESCEACSPGPLWYDPTRLACDSH